MLSVSLRLDMYFHAHFDFVLYVCMYYEYFKWICQFQFNIKLLSICFLCNCYCKSYENKKTISLLHSRFIYASKET